MGYLKKYIKKIVKVPILAIYHILLLIRRVDKKTIIFESNLGRNYSGNPRFIYEEMVRRGLDCKYKCYFMLQDINTTIPGNAKKIKRISFSYFLLFAQAGFWVSDSRMPGYLIKRKKTIYIQTWHGTPLKRLGLDMTNVSMEGETSLKDYKSNFVKNAASWDYLISQSLYASEIFCRAFEFQNKILEIGYPRNDILINNNNAEMIQSIKKLLHLPSDKKILLYAPTWRDNEYYGPHQYKFSSHMDFSYMRGKLGEEYIILVKAHYLVTQEIDFSAYKGFLYHFGAEIDIAELYLISDLLITDYSSVMFDYSLLKRPMLFYTYDLDYYKEHIRGFYFDLTKEAPGPVVTTTQQLVKAILDGRFEQYELKYKAFIQKFNHADKGMASKQVVDLIISHGGVIY